jgi:hypothetical protein
MSFVPKRILNNHHRSLTDPVLHFQPAHHKPHRLFTTPRRIPAPGATKHVAHRSHSAPTRTLFTFSNNMSSDDAYSSFLDKANQDTGGSKATTQSKKASTKAVDTEVPKTLEGLDEYYVSEADEPFEPVSLKWDGDSLPSNGACAPSSKHFNTNTYFIQRNSAV